MCIICFMSHLSSTDLVTTKTQVSFSIESQEGFSILVRNRTPKHTGSYGASSTHLAISLGFPFHYMHKIMKTVCYKRTSVVVLSEIFYLQTFQSKQQGLKKVSLHYLLLLANKAAGEDKKYHHVRSNSKQVSPPQKFSRPCYYFFPSSSWVRRSQ